MAKDKTKQTKVKKEAREHVKNGGISKSSSKKEKKDITIKAAKEAKIAKKVNSQKTNATKDNKKGSKDEKKNDSKKKENKKQRVASDSEESDSSSSSSISSTSSSSESGSDTSGEKEVKFSKNRKINNSHQSSDSDSSGSNSDPEKVRNKGKTSSLEKATKFSEKNSKDRDSGSDLSESESESSSSESDSSSKDSVSKAKMASNTQKVQKDSAAFDSEDEKNAIDTKRTSKKGSSSASSESGSESEASASSVSQSSSDSESTDSGSDSESSGIKGENVVKSKNDLKTSSESVSESSSAESASELKSDKSSGSTSSSESESSESESESDSSSSQKGIVVQKEVENIKVGNKRKGENEKPIPQKRAKQNEIISENMSGSKTIFVGRLSWNVDDEWLRREFESYGKVLNARVMTSDGRSKGFGFVDFDTSEAAQAALQAQGKEIDGRPINVDLSTPRPAPSNIANNRADKYGDQQSQISDTVFVGNCAFSMTQDDLYKAFEDCGEIAGVRLITDRDTGNFKGYGYISFKDTTGAENMVKRNGELVCGRPLRLDYALPRNNDSQNGNGRGNVGRGGSSNRGRGGRTSSSGPRSQNSSMGRKSFSGQKITF